MKLFNGEKFSILSHYDLDGIGCCILFKKVFGDQVHSFIPSGLQYLEQNINKLSFQSDNIIITDLSLNQEDIDLVDLLFKGKYLVDHHETTLERVIPFKKYVSTKASATFLCYNLLSKLYQFDSNMKRFVQLVNDYDIWIHKHKESTLLNNAFWILKPDKFFQEFKDGCVNFVPGNKIYNQSAELENKKISDINGFESWVIENKLRIVVADDHISDISLHYPEQFFAIVRPTNHISLRSKTIPLSNFYKTLEQNDIKCGGHSLAGGTEPIQDEEKRMEVFELFWNYIEENS